MGVQLTAVLKLVEASTRFMMRWMSAFETCTVYVYASHWYVCVPLVIGTCICVPLVHVCVSHWSLVHVCASHWYVCPIGTCRCVPLACAENIHCTYEVEVVFLGSHVCYHLVLGNQNDK